MTDAPLPLPRGFRSHVANIGIKDDTKDFVVVVADQGEDTLGIVDVGPQQNVVVAGVPLQIEEAGIPLFIFVQFLHILIDGDEMAAGGLQFLGDIAPDPAEAAKNVVSL